MRKLTDEVITPDAQVRKFQRLDFAIPEFEITGSRRRRQNGQYECDSGNGVSIDVPVCIKH
jgi:hypothetical protein